MRRLYGYNDEHTAAVASVVYIQIRIESGIIIKNYN